MKTLYSSLISFLHSEENLKKPTIGIVEILKYALSRMDGTKVFDGNRYYTKEIDMNMWLILDKLRKKIYLIKKDNDRFYELRYFNKKEIIDIFQLERFFENGGGRK